MEHIRFCREIFDTWRRVIGTYIDAGVALNALIRIPFNGASNNGKRIGGARFYAGATSHAEALRLRIVTISAMNIAALNENGCTSTWAIYQGKWNDIVNRNMRRHMPSPALR